MADPVSERDRPLNILHVLRAPLGGLFRHVLDLSREQVRRGHAVGLVTDSLTGGPAAERILAELKPQLRLGIRRTPMHRNPHATDIASLARVARWSRDLSADIVHGHGSKGGVHARLPALWSGPSGPARVYTPHGGSLNHHPGSVSSRFYMRVERLLAARTDLLLFESAFVAERFKAMVGTPPHLYRIVHNGIGESEFVPVRPDPDAAEFLYVGELRAAKGLDVLVDALAVVAKTTGSSPRACLVGTGPERDALQQQAHGLGVGHAITFAGALPAREAFRRGRILVLPSRAESLPYVALEAAGARIPLITTHVGGIPEVFGPYAAALLPPNDVARLASRMMESLSAPETELAQAADRLARFVQAKFSLETMVDGILAAYHDAMAGRRARRPLAAPAALLLPSCDQGTET